MNFELSDEQQLLADSLRKYLTNDYSFDARTKFVASPTGYSEKTWAAFAEMGLLGIPFAEEHGGFGGNAVDLMSVMEVLGESLVVEPYWTNVGVAGRLVATGGSEAQRKRILPALIQGKQRLAFAHTEAASRYDLRYVGARAKRTSGGFTLEAEKRAVLHAASADTLIVSARTSGGDTDPSGISLFLVDRGARGVTL
jgi:alkylation response protein AidB-like acyl-CoA dehydrogenase